jgi:hypothetical protein
MTLKKIKIIKNKNLSIIFIFQNREILRRRIRKPTNKIIVALVEFHSQIEMAWQSVNQKFI